MTGVSGMLNGMPLHVARAVLVSFLALNSQGASPTYFMVGPMFPILAPRSTFLLPLTKEEDITQARAIINGDTSIASIVMAVVGPGADCINRDYSSSNLREWSWHVGQFHKFADAITETIQVTPDQLESRDWSKPYPQYAGFYDMKVVRELGSTPLEIRTEISGGDLSIFWSCLGTNWAYTLETTILPTADRDTQQWFPIPGVAWPQTTNSWHIHLHTTNQLFRIKATPLDLIKNEHTPKAALELSLFAH